MPTFTAGLNIAMKIPRADFDATVAFYRDVLGFDVSEEDPGTPSISQGEHLFGGPVDPTLAMIGGIQRSPATRSA